MDDALAPLTHAAQFRAPRSQPWEVAEPLRSEGQACHGRKGDGPQFESQRLLASLFEEFYRARWVAAHKGYLPGIEGREGLNNTIGVLSEDGGRGPEEFIAAIVVPTRHLHDRNVGESSGYELRIKCAPR